MANRLRERADYVIAGQRKESKYVAMLNKLSGSQIAFIGK